MATKVTDLCHRVSVKELPTVTLANVIRALEADIKDTEPREKSISQDHIHTFLATTELKNKREYGWSSGKASFLKDTPTTTRK